MEALEVGGVDFLLSATRFHPLAHALCLGQRFAGFAMRLKLLEQDLGPDLLLPRFPRFNWLA